MVGNESQHHPALSPDISFLEGPSELFLASSCCWGCLGRPPHQHPSLSDGKENNCFPNCFATLIKKKSLVQGEMFFCCVIFKDVQEKLAFLNYFSS